MAWLAALAALAANPQPNAWAPAAAVQATATVRIISGARLKLDAEANPGAPRARRTKLTTPDGVTRPARLIEFQ